MADCSASGGALPEAQSSPPNASLDEAQFSKLVAAVKQCNPETKIAAMTDIARAIKLQPNEDPRYILTNEEFIKSLGEKFYSRFLSAYSCDWEPNKYQQEVLKSECIKVIVSLLFRFVLRPQYTSSVNKAKHLIPPYNPVAMINDIAKVPYIKQILNEMPREMKISVLFSSIFWSHYNLVLYDPGKNAADRFASDICCCFDALHKGLGLDGELRNSRNESASACYEAATKTLMNDKNPSGRMLLPFDSSVFTFLKYYYP